MLAKNNMNNKYTFQHVIIYEGIFYHTCIYAFALSINENGDFYLFVRTKSIIYHTDKLKIYSGTPL